MQINLSFDASVDDAPAAFKTDVEAVAAMYDRTFSTNITIDISVGYGEIDGTTITDGGGESEWFYGDYSYAKVRAALAATATSTIDQAAVASLPTTNFLGNRQVIVPDAEATALGLMSGVTQGYVGFDSTTSWDYNATEAVAGELDFTAVAEHEISEVLGRDSNAGDGSNVTVLDLFRYSAPGVRNFNPTTAYFSLDGGKTNLGNFNTVAGGDTGDWASSVTDDAFDAFSDTGVINALSTTDLNVLDAIGYTYAAATAAPSISGGGGSATIWASGSIAPFSAVTLVDPNINQTETLTVRLSSPSAGGLSNLGGGTYSTASGTYSFTGALAAAQTALAGLVFTPVEGTAGTSATTTLTIGLADAVAAATSESVSVIANTPASIIIAGTASGQAVTTPGSVAPFSRVGLTDPNDTATETVSVTFPLANGGTLSNLGGGTLTGGYWTLTGSPGAAQEALDGLLYTPGTAAVMQVGTQVTGFTITVADGLTTTTNTATTVIATAPAPPTISGTVAGQTVLATGAIAPFAHVAFADPTAGLTETATVTLSTPGNGSLASPDGGAFNPTTGVYTIAGALAAVTGAIDDLVFTPSASVLSPGSSDITDFTITLSNAIAAAASDATTTVTAFNPSTTLPDLAAVLSPLGKLALDTTLLRLSPAGTVNDVVTVSGAGGGLAVPSGTLDAIVLTGVPAGTFTELPGGYQLDYLFGNAGAQAYDASGSVAIVATAANAVVEGNGNDTVIGGNAAETLIGGAGAETLVGGTGANFFWLGTGADSVVSQGSDTLVGGTGSATVTATGSPLFFVGSGATSFAGESGAPTLVGGGAETIVAGGASPLVFGGTGLLVYTQGSGSATVVGGAQQGVSLTGGSAPLLYFGNGASTYTGGAAVDTILGGTGSLTATGGTGGGLLFAGSAGSDVLTAGPGPTTIIGGPGGGGGGGDILNAAGAASDVIAAGSGPTTINGGAATGSDVLFGGSGADCIVAGAGATAILAGSGNDTLLTGSIGSTLLEFAAGSTARDDLVVGFHAGADFISLVGFAADTASLVAANAVTAAGSTTIALPDGTHVTFQGVSRLSASSFV